MAKLSNIGHARGSQPHSVSTSSLHLDTQPWIFKTIRLRLEIQLFLDKLQEARAFVLGSHGHGLSGVVVETCPLFQFRRESQKQRPPYFIFTTFANVGAHSKSRSRLSDSILSRTHLSTLTSLWYSYTSRLSQLLPVRSVNHNISQPNIGLPI